MSFLVLCMLRLRKNQPLIKEISSSFTMSLRVVHIPCGAPLTTLSFAFLMIFADSRAESAIGTIWSSSPCRTSAGTSIFLRSSVRSVSENALMQKYEAGRPAIIPWSQKDSRTPSETLAPGLLCDLSSTGGVPDVDGVLQIELFGQRREVVGVGVHVVAVPGPARAAVAAAIVRDAAVAARGQEEHLVLEGVRAQRPAMAEDDGLP